LDGHISLLKKDFVFVHDGFANPVVVHRQLDAPITFRFRRYHAFIPESKLGHFTARKWKKKWPYHGSEKHGDLAAVFEFK
jgi:hypothetical protein